MKIDPEPVHVTRHFYEDTGNGRALKGTVVALTHINLEGDDPVTEIVYGVSICSDKDQFCRKTGRHIAAARALARKGAFGTVDTYGLAANLADQSATVKTITGDVDLDILAYLHQTEQLPEDCDSVPTIKSGSIKGVAKSLVLAYPTIVQCCESVFFRANKKARQYAEKGILAAV